MDFVRVIGWHLRQNGVKAFAIVPKTPPGEFVTVELTGMSSGRVPGIVEGTVAVQCWADSEQKAAGLLHKCRRLMETLPGVGTRVVTAVVVSAYSWPDPEGAKYRYQMVVSLLGYDHE